MLQELFSLIGGIGTKRKQKIKMTAYGGFLIIAKLLENLEFPEHVKKMFPFVEMSPIRVRFRVLG